MLLAGRVIQGVGGAIASPTALSLITTEFEEGKARNRAFAVFAAVAGAGAALGLLLGGMLTEYLDWRWVLFVNVPIGVALMIGGIPVHPRVRAAHRPIRHGSAPCCRWPAWSAGIRLHPRGPRRLEQLGTTVGRSTLRWCSSARSSRGRRTAPNAMMPLRIFANRSRSGSYLVMLIIGAAMFGMFYFLTFFVQGVLGYSALKAGVAFLPFCVGDRHRIADSRARSCRDRVRRS